MRRRSGDKLTRRPPPRRDARTQEHSGRSALTPAPQREQPHQRGGEDDANASAARRARRTAGAAAGARLEPKENVGRWLRGIRGPWGIRWLGGLAPAGPLPGGADTTATVGGAPAAAAVRAGCADAPAVHVRLVLVLRPVVAGRLLRADSLGAVAARAVRRSLAGVPHRAVGTPPTTIRVRLVLVPEAVEARRALDAGVVDAWILGARITRPDASGPQLGAVWRVPLAAEPRQGRLPIVELTEERHDLLQLDLAQGDALVGRDGLGQRRCRAIVQVRGRVPRVEQGGDGDAHERPEEPLAARWREGADVVDDVPIFIGEARAVVAGRAPRRDEHLPTSGPLGGRLPSGAVGARRRSIQGRHVRGERVELHARSGLRIAQGVADGPAAVELVGQQPRPPGERADLPLEILHLVEVPA